MGKNSVKIYDSARASAVNWTAQKHQCTKEYVRSIINGTRSGGRSEEILKDFRKKYAELSKALSQPKA